MKYPAVKIENLNFNYPHQPGKFFSQLNLEIAPGERFGLFGPNGAGTTTLMNLMTGVLTYTEGNISLLGNSIKSKNKRVNQLFGYVPQDLSFYQELSPVENLEFFGAWSGLDKTETKKRTGELLDLFELTAVSNKPSEKLSGGMKRRINLAIGVIHKPRILFLDEPTVGVDARTRVDIINYLKELNNNGTTLIYTSHQLNEAEGLCKKIALIDEGKIIASGDLDKLLSDYGQQELEGLFLNLTGNDSMNS